ncbi:MFS transporter [Nocardiopsis gilva]
MSVDARERACDQTSSDGTSADPAGGGGQAPGTGIEPPGGARAWLVWGVAVGVYFLAMFHRNGLGVAALEAQERFHVGPALLSVLPVVQLIVYVALQVPTGVMADRLGPRKTLLIGLAAMTVGVAMFALAPSIEVAITARVLIGLGDAVTFLNVIRLGALWFPRKQYALVSAFTGTIGGLGQVASVVPLSAALHQLGWTAAFLATGAVTGVMMLLVLLVVRDRPAGMRATAHHHAPVPVRVSLVEALRARGPRVGMASHVVLQAPYTMLAALWGYPFLVEGLGMAPAAAGLVLTVLGVATLWVSPVLGAFIGRFPRIRAVFGVGLGMVLSAGWIAIVAWPGGPPVALVIAHFTVACAAMAMAAPISFDFARDGIPAQRTGVASSLVNMSGFTAVVVTVLLAGMILESGAGFQAAFVPVTVTTVLGTAVFAALLRRYPRST